MTVRYVVGDSATVVATLPDASVSLVATSPPFLALRSYLPDGHPDKGAEIGSEPNPGAFLNRLLELTAEWGRVLAPWGSIAIELGDTYSGSGGAGGDYNEGGLRDGQNAFVGSSSLERRIDTNRPKVSNGTGSAIRDLHGKKSGGGSGWPRPKCLALIPQAYALSLAYGINCITGQPSPAGQWLVRNVIVWHRPNPAVGALGDKVRPSTSYITVATRSAKRWFDLDAVRTEAKEFGPRYTASTYEPPGQAARNIKPVGADGLRIQANTAGAPPLDCWFDEQDTDIDLGVFADDFHDTWTINTQPSSLAHFAMWPAKLAERLILMMCPASVCSTCGEPRRRINDVVTLDSYRDSRRPQTQRAVALADRNGLTDAHIAAIRSLGINDIGKNLAMKNGVVPNIAAVVRLAGEAKAVLGGYFREFVSTNEATLRSSWSTCGHDAYAPGTVLDPFAGSGTTLATADFHGRDAIGIDLDERNRDIYPARREEVARALNPTHVRTIDGQLDIFGGAA